jgi:hypothetical protein
VLFCPNAAARHQLANRVPRALQPAPPRHLERNVGGGARGDGQPEVHQPPGQHAECRDAAGEAEADQQQGSRAVDDAQAARGDRQHADDVRDPVGGEQLGRVHEAAERRYEAPQRRGVEQPVEGRPRQRRRQHGPVPGQIPDRRSDLQEQPLELIAVQAGNPAANGVHDPARPALAAGEPERERSHQEQSHRADNGDRHVDRVKAGQRYRDHQGQPQQGVQDDGGPHALGRHHHPGIGPGDPFRGEQPVPDASAAHGARGDHVRHRGRGQVNPEQPGQPGLAGRRQQRPGQQRVAEQRRDLEHEAGDHPADIQVAEQAQILAGADQLGDDQVLDDQEQDEDDQASPERSRDPGFQAAPRWPAGPGRYLVGAHHSPFPIGKAACGPRSRAWPAAAPKPPGAPTIGGATFTSGGTASRARSSLSLAGPSSGGWHG